MEIILHRRNSIIELQQTDSRYGVEVDIRSNNKELIVQHEPFADGESFQDWLRLYEHGTLILNVKEEGLEEELLNILKKNGIDRYFFLDQSFPFLIRYANASGGNSAVRVSEFESVETALKLEGTVNWVWVDCFNNFPLSKEQADKLKKANFKLCIVSPELQGRVSEQEIQNLATTLLNRRIKPEAVCTKTPSQWENTPLCS
tara:strand:- start:143 stop:748 length:606 start_codon:yes stop_codon:yes gene_type:complete